MYFMPFGMGNNNQPSAIDELDKTIKFYEHMKKSFKEDNEKDKKKDPPKKPIGDVIATAMFFTFATPFIMGIWLWLMLKMGVDILESIARIKGLH